MQSLNINCETGEETFIDLSANEIAEVEAKMEQALAEQATELTLEQKLESLGLSVADLKKAFGL